VSFTSPEWLLGLLIIPAGLLFYWWIQQRRAKYAVRFTNVDLLANVVDKTPGWRRHLPAALYLLAIGSLIIALARPQTTVAVPKEEATVVLVMDISGSMNAEDVDPTRLEAARDAAKLLVDELPEKFQVALVVFANGVQTVAPPTNDREEIMEGLDRLRAQGGTAMGDAIAQALDLARPPILTDNGAQPNGSGATPGATPDPQAPEFEERPAVIVLLGDGANSTGFTDPLDAAQDSADREVPIFTVALGTDAGVVDVPDQFGQIRRIPVPPDRATLQAIADLTEGRYFDAPSADELKSVYSDLGSKIGYEDEEKEITYVFAGIATALLIAGTGFAMYWFNRFP
jgi:Ca-activated chloride channel family protein